MMNYFTTYAKSILLTILLFNSIISAEGSVDPRRLQWSSTVANLANVYFSKPYKSNPLDKLNCPDGSVVYRPNHSLAHGMRQAFLAVDIARFVRYAKLPPSEKIDNTPLFQLQQWIIEKNKEDPTFFEKLEFANAFQRSGRESDAGKDSDPVAYERYLDNDEANLWDNALKFKGKGKLFKDNSEIIPYRRAIVEKFSPQEFAQNEKDVVMLSRLFYTAHTLDLRRLTNFTKLTILNNVALQIFGKKVGELNTWEKGMLDRLWEQSGRYLAATGDRDMEPPARTDYDLPVFCAQAHNPDLLVEKLHEARKSWEETFTESIVSHIDVLRDLKEQQGQKDAAVSPVQHTREQEVRIRRLKAQLKKAHYTASEGFLKLQLGKKYKEIPTQAGETITRKILELNIREFLKEVKTREIKVGNKVELYTGPRVENPDDHYVKTLVDCMMEERRHPDKIVFYHTTEPEMGFLYDTYTPLRNTINMSGGRDLRAMRVLDTRFLNMDAIRGDTAETPYKTGVEEFAQEFKKLADDNALYRLTTISVNFALSASDLVLNADTYNMFNVVKDRPVVTQELDYAKFFDSVQQELGIPGSHDAYKTLADKYVLKDENGAPQRNGRLVQIFVDPEALLDIGYFSTLLGAQVLKDGLNPSLDEPIVLLRTDPESLLDYIKDAKGAYLFGINDKLLRTEGVGLNDLQARLYIRPEIMFNNSLVIIKSYWRFPMSENRLKAYYRDISQLMNKNIALWIRQGRPAQEGSIAPETNKLDAYVEQLYKSITEKDAPKAPPTPLGEQFIRLLDSERYSEATNMLKTRFDDLKSLNLKKLIRDNFGNEDLVKIAFEKEIIPGGMDTLEVYQSMNGSNRGALRWYLLPSNPAEAYSSDQIVATSKLYLKLFKDINDAYLYETILKTGADEGLLEDSIKFSRELPELNNMDYLVKSLEPIPPSVRLKTFEWIKNYISQNPENEQRFKKKPLSLIKLIATNLDKTDDYISTIIKLYIKFFFGSGGEDKLKNINLLILEGLYEDLESTPDFSSIENIRQKGWDLTSWVWALPDTPDPLAEQEFKCPNKAFIRGFISQKYEKRKILDKTDFDFNEKDKTWHASSIHFILPKGMEGRPETPEEAMERLPELELVYNTSRTGDDWCHAQFHKNGLNVLTMHLNRRK